MGGRYVNFNCTLIDIMTPNKQPECVECTEHEMIREGSIHQIKAMNCRVKPSDPVFFDTTATEQPEWEKEFDEVFKESTIDFGYEFDKWVVKDFIRTLISSRDTYWKERVRKSFDEWNQSTEDIQDWADREFPPITNEDNLK